MWKDPNSARTLKNRKGLFVPLYNNKLLDRRYPNEQLLYSNRCVLNEAVSLAKRSTTTMVMATGKNRLPSAIHTLFLNFMNSHAEPAIACRWGKKAGNLIKNHSVAVLATRQFALLVGLHLTIERSTLEITM